MEASKKLQNIIETVSLCGFTLWIGGRIAEAFWENPIFTTLQYIGVSLIILCIIVRFFFWKTYRRDNILALWFFGIVGLIILAILYFGR